MADIDWGHLLEQVKVGEGLISDADLAVRLDVRPEQISKAKNGTEELPIHAKFIVLLRGKLVTLDGPAFQLLPGKAREKVLAITSGICPVQAGTVEASQERA